MYHVLDLTSLRTRARYDRGRLPFTAPLACDVADAAGTIERAEYVAGSMLDYGAARYTIDGATYELQRNGELRPVANKERRAA